MSHDKHVRWTMGWGVVPNNEFVCNKLNSEFLIGEVEYSQSCECLESLPSSGALDDEG